MNQRCESKLWMNGSKLPKLCWRMAEHILILGDRRIHLCGLHYESYLECIWQRADNPDDPRCAGSNKLLKRNGISPRYKMRMC